ncbi:DUF1697 domain-containing protein [Pseudoxanthomonas helianthi]|uniref:DUF1697 domain-containing protein n=1 Tax=Pseudoxanthomonas helianthi TaxID=1453541 RepID=A0A940X6Q1_9GAMM|nr:DUF1697 domain-containing protein [Pseudoxanthomonas helianthi]MBP3985249.1 DUF1697 domain-containing protein [Pseudoxanthomonas helianthi]
MPRYIALLRGVSPMNAKMPELKRCFEDAGFGNVRTLLSSGNVAFDSPKRSELSLARKIEAAMAQSLDRSFWTVVRPASHLQALIEADPFASLHLPEKAKKVVTFLREPPTARLALPMEKNGARILAMRGLEILTAYTPQPGNPAFMALLERTFGGEITTRTWDTVRKCAAA